MRRIIESTFVTLDGIIGDPRSWAGDYFDRAAQAAALEELRACDAMLMGRGTYEYFAPAWPALDSEYAKQINTMPKYVFSSTLQAADWSNTTVVRGDAPSAVFALKRGDGADLVIYGHGRFAQSLLDHGLIDQLRLAIHPLFLGHGQRIFDRDQPEKFALIGARTLASGVTIATYQPAR